MVRRHRRLACWLALAALMLVTLVPTMARVLAAVPALAEICAVDAVPVASADGPRPRDDAPQDQHLFDHCPYCVLHADLAPPPAAAAAVATRAASWRALPAAFRAAPRASVVWSRAQPRAPPALG